MGKQHTEILHILQTNKSKGMNSYTWRTKYIQLPVRIRELKQLGYEIVSRSEKNRSVTYILLDTLTNKTLATKESVTQEQIALVKVRKYIGGKEVITWETPTTKQEAFI